MALHCLFADILLPAFFPGASHQIPFYPKHLHLFLLYADLLFHRKGALHSHRLQPLSFTVVYKHILADLSLKNAATASKQPDPVAETTIQPSIADVKENNCDTN